MYFLVRGKGKRRSCSGGGMGESMGEGFSVYKGVTLLLKPVLLGWHQFREETIS